MAGELLDLGVDGQHDPARLDADLRRRADHDPRRQGAGMQLRRELAVESAGPAQGQRLLRAAGPTP